jgi:hypothetical protein
MNKLFCAYQYKIEGRDDTERIKYLCTIYNKECPYNKPEKAERKCQNYDKR